VSLLTRIRRGKEPLPPRLVLYGTEGIGKAQPLDAKVLTPQGFVNMGSLQVGDLVISSNGQPCAVLSVHPQGLKDVYRVTFRDGSVTHCCEDHLWFTQTVGERERGLGGAVRTLRDIRRTLRYGTQFNHAVPRVQPVQFAAQNLPTDPWLLGIYLGDGTCNGSVVIANPEPDLGERIRQVVAQDGDHVVPYDDLNPPQQPRRRRPGA